MELDVRTLFIVNAADTFLIAFVVFFIYKWQKIGSSLKEISLAYFVMAWGGLLIREFNS